MGESDLVYMAFKKTSHIKVQACEGRHKDYHTFHIIISLLCAPQYEFCLCHLNLKGYWSMSDSIVYSRLPNSNTFIAYIAFDVTPDELLS